MFETVAGRISFSGNGIPRQRLFEKVAGNRIKAAGSPGVTAEDPFQGQPASGKRAIETQGIGGVKGA